MSSNRSPTRARSRSPSQQTSADVGGGDQRPPPRGRGGYRRGVQPELNTIPEGIKSLQGDQGRPLKLITNFVKLKPSTSLAVYQYRVEFEPEIESVRLRTKLLFMQQDLFKRRLLYDGSNDMKSIVFLEDEVTTVSLKHPYSKEGEMITITITRTGEDELANLEMLRVYNDSMKFIMKKLGYFRLKKDLLHDSLRSPLPGNHGISIIGGYRTVASLHDGGILMNMDYISKVIQDITILSMMKALYKRDSTNFQATVRAELANTIIITKYNNKIYKIQDFKFNMNPESTFSTKKGDQISFIDYYANAYPNLKITDRGQPLILVTPDNEFRKQRERNANQQQEKPSVDREIILIPELCYLTGMTPSQRADNRLKMDMIKHSQVSPENRVKNLRKFLQILDDCESAKRECERWDYTFEKDLVELNGRQMEPERICWGNSKGKAPATWPKCEPPGSFDRTVKGASLFGTPKLDKMVFIISRPNAQLLDPIQQNLSKAFGQLNMPLSGRNVKLVKLPDDKLQTFVDACRAVEDDSTIVLILLPNSNKDRYVSCKKILTCDRGIPSQCFTAKLMSDDRKATSACVKLAIQMACKIGGEPWCLNIPAKETMVCGYDTYSDMSSRGNTIGAFCSSTNTTMTRWWSKVGRYDKLETLSTGLANCLVEGLKKWLDLNKSLPSKIMLYRDGVNEGQMEHVYHIELKGIKKAIERLADVGQLKLSVVIVTKKIGTKFFWRESPTSIQNPPPGTIIDSEVTRQARYDFFLVSQLTRQGTVSPTMYNVIEDSTGLQPQHQQMLAYKLCHLYFNWTGTVRVPAPCQYAHKLALLVGDCLHAQPHIQLSEYLHFL